MIDNKQYTVFQSHYRSDFNPILSPIFLKQLHFNPIIGLILTTSTNTNTNANDNFNPIIGLILTYVQRTDVSMEIVFQSHYRSDFNALINCVSPHRGGISIPL